MKAMCGFEFTEDENGVIYGAHTIQGWNPSGPETKMSKLYFHLRKCTEEFMGQTHDLAIKQEVLIDPPT